MGYFSVIALATVILHVFSPRKVTDPKLSPLLGQLMVDVVLKLHMPVLICDMDGKIIWYNRTLSSLVGGREALYGATTENLCGILPENMESGVAIENIQLGDRSFASLAYEIKTGDREYRLMIFNDSTDLDQLRIKFDEEDTVVMYVIIDNLDELLQSARNHLLFFLWHPQSVFLHLPLFSLIPFHQKSVLSFRLLTLCVHQPALS